MIGFGRPSVVAQLATGAKEDESRTVLAEADTRVSPDPTPDGGASPASGEKYEVIAPIGRGGMGEVLLIRDRDLRREIAMKVIRPEYASGAEMKRKFVAEAQATAQLEHPGIPPVHDVGTRPDGSLYFTMKIVRGKTLTQVLRDLLLGVKEARKEYTLHRLMSILERMAEALEFAHEKGVIHRDLKPDNVMLGSYGEVHIMDWGLAKIAGAATGSDAESSVEVAVRTDATDAGLQTMAGTIQGTIPYMSPEQARGEPLDRRSDVYAMGVILYEMLTLHRAFEGANLLTRVQQGTFAPVETRNPERAVPEALASLCRRAMDRDPAKRPPTAQAFAAELRAWLDGRAERERRHKEAEALAVQGREAMARYVAGQGAIDDAERASRAAAARLKQWQSLDEKLPLLEARDAIAAARKAHALAFAETSKLLEAAIIAEEENATARGLLAALWRIRLEDAERRREASDADFALTMIRRYDDGRLAAYVAGDGSLELTTDPPGAEVTIARFEDRRGVLHLGESRPLGRTPLAPAALPMGSYLCIVRHPGFRDVRYPVHITRNRAWKGRVKVRTDHEIGDGFVLVPGGPFIYGEGTDTKTLELPDFAIAEKPVTLGDWAEFLAAVGEEKGPEAAQKLCPGTAGDGPLMERRGDGTWVPLPNNVEGPARERCLREHGPDFERLLPVTCVSWHDSVAYCAWRSKTTGREWRLPTEKEREKAARGADGRVFPWGDLADATLGKCDHSRDEPSQPEPVGCFPAATSVYGVIDASGNTWDWTDSWFDSRSTLRELRGGSWNDPIVGLRCANRSRRVPGFRNATYGLRPARSVTP
ncbi:MAG: Serine/threonine-protein kinase PknD [Planctomycetes bacterium]|nr:Serine/threonine-protein kinase PknD [Planctomycetota bacterium]